MTASAARHASLWSREASVLSWGAVLGPVIFTAAWLVLGFVSPGYTLWGTRVAPYSPISQPLSGLGLGPTGPFMNTAFVASGLLLVAGPIGIAHAIWPLDARSRRVAGALLALPGLGAVIDGFFTFESFMPHFLGFGLALSAIAGFPVVGVLLRRELRWQHFGTALIAAGPLTAALTILYFATFTPTVEGIQSGVAGLTERILVVELQAWYVALGALALRQSGSMRGGS